MPVASVLGCEERSGYALEQFLLYLGFETRCGEEGEADVAVIASPAGCPRARVVVAGRGPALRCGGRLAELAGMLDPPRSVLVDRGEGLIVYWGDRQVFMVMRELERLLRWRGLLYATPPLGRDEILRYRPG